MTTAPPPASPPWHQTLLRPTHRRHREARRWALATLAATLLFLVWPELDLLISGAALGPAGGPRFPWGAWAPVQALYHGIPVFGRLLLLACLLMLLVPRGWRQRAPRLCRWRQRAIGLLLALVFGLGLAVNAGLKEVWGRPRPINVIELGGEHPFKQINQPSTLCQTNCSFVSGHAGTGFVLLGVGLLATPATRRRWWRIGLACGTVFGIGRILQGGHFTSDVLFSGLVIWGVGLLCQQAWTRRRAQRLQRRHALR